MFFTETQHYVTISSVTSSHHVTDLHVYRAPSVGDNARLNDVISCRVARVDHNGLMMRDGVTWPFTLSPSNDNDYTHRYYNNTVSLYVKPRQQTTQESRDQGTHVLHTVS